jgi:hypothetical protein
MQRAISALIVSILVAMLLCFWATLPAQRDALVTWAGLFVIAAGTLSLSIVAHRELRTWRGFGMVLLLHVAAQAWLQWQWDLWDSPVTLIRNLNVVAGLVAFASLIALVVSLILLLIFRDASLIALAVAWLGCPILLLGTMSRYQTYAHLNDVAFREEILLIVPICLLPLLVIFGGIGFFAHYFLLIGKEITRQEI